MSDSPHPHSIDSARAQSRLRVPAMYTLLRVRKAGDSRYRWTGHIYDINRSGMRFELDTPLDPGTEVEVRGMLPGDAQTTFRATGRIVRLQDDDQEAGPCRMGMVFSSFYSSNDEHRLSHYLNHHGLAA